MSSRISEIPNTVSQEAKDRNGQDVAGRILDVLGYAKGGKADLNAYQLSLLGPIQSLYQLRCLTSFIMYYGMKRNIREICSSNGTSKFQTMRNNISNINGKFKQDPTLANNIIHEICKIRGASIYQHNLKNQEFDKKASPNLCSKDKAIAEGQQKEVPPLLGDDDYIYEENPDDDFDGENKRFLTLLDRIEPPILGKRTFDEIVDLLEGER
jgi:hypothetical protein